MSEYRSALDALFAKTGSTARLGLDRTRSLLELLGNPHERYPTFHIAGTNGKGSVAAILDALLTAKALRVGRYTSPHIGDFAERVMVAGRLVERGYVLEFLRKWSEPAEELEATFFEITTALAFKYFADSGVDVAVIETGLGGRLDATNVIMPVAAGIVSVALDHQDYLGDTIEKIAREKAGIFKRGAPAIIGDVKPEIARVIAQDAFTRGCDLVHLASREYPVTDISLSDNGTQFTLHRAEKSCRVTLGLVGAHQAYNASLAMSMLAAAGDAFEVTLETARRVLPGLRVPGRFQRIDKYVLDVAHNPHAVEQLVKTVVAANLERPISVVVAVLGDKDWRSILGALATIAHELVLSSHATAPVSRRWKIDEVREWCSDRGLQTREAPSIPVGLAMAAQNAATVLVTGSFHTVEEALQVLGSSDERR